MRFNLRCSVIRPQRDNHHVATNCTGTHPPALTGSQVHKSQRVLVIQYSQIRACPSYQADTDNQPDNQPDKASQRLITDSQDNPYRKLIVCFCHLCRVVPHTTDTPTIVHLGLTGLSASSDKFLTVDNKRPFEIHPMQSIPRSTVCELLGLHIRSSPSRVRVHQHDPDQ